MPPPLATEDPPPATLATRDWGGPAGAPLLVLLHGLGDSGACWPDAARRWTVRYRVVSVDLLGHGRSPRFTAAQLQASDPMEEMYAAAERSVATLTDRTGRAVLVAHSMGGGVATSLAARRPDLVLGAVLEEPAWRDPADRVQPGDIIEERIADCRAFATDPDGALAAGREENPGWPEEEYPPWAEAKRQVDLDFLALGVATFTTPWETWLRDLTVPALAVIGERSGLLPAPVRHRAAAVGNAHLTVEVVAGAGHCVRREVPDAFHRLVDPWLADLTG
jgi:pimeloyl-ACP methyl ester carboxylesterase